MGLWGCCCSASCAKFSCKPHSELRTGPGGVNSPSLLQHKLDPSLARKSHGSLARYSAAVLTEIPHVCLFRDAQDKKRRLPHGGDPITVAFLFGALQEAQHRAQREASVTAPATTRLSGPTPNRSRSKEGSNVPEQLPAGLCNSNCNHL